MLSQLTCQETVMVVVMMMDDDDDDSLTEGYSVPGALLTVLSEELI